MVPASLKSWCRSSEAIPGTSTTALCILLRVVEHVYLGLRCAPPPPQPPWPPTAGLPHADRFRLPPRRLRSRQYRRYGAQLQLTSSATVQLMLGCCYYVSLPECSSIVYGCFPLRYMFAATPSGHARVSSAMAKCTSAWDSLHFHTYEGGARRW